MTRRKTRAERYEDVLEAAAEVFASLGYRAASIHRVAAELDMTGAALYHYVESKEELLVEICRRAGTGLLEAAQEVAASELAPAEKLRALFHRHLEVTMADRAAFTILIQERSELPEDRVEEFLEGERVYFATVRSVLEQYAPKDTGGQDTHLATFAVLGMLNWTLRWYKEDGASSLAEIADQFVRVFAAGFLVGDARREIEALLDRDPPRSLGRLQLEEMARANGGEGGE